MNWKGVKIIVLLVSTIWLEVKSENQARRFEEEGCETLIPAFIDQILESGENNGECDQAGEYPKPGDCTVFFKCVRGRGRIEPFLEYCAVGYTFIGNACIRNSNSSDCPQFSCNPLKSSAEVSNEEVTSSQEQAVSQPVTDEIQSLNKSKHNRGENSAIYDSNKNRVGNNSTFTTTTASNDDESKNELGFGLTAAQKSVDIQNAGSSLFYRFYGITIVLTVFSEHVFSKIF